MRKKIEVSYGVEPPQKEEVSLKVKEESYAVDSPVPKKPKGLLQEIEDLKRKGETRTPEFRDKMRQLEAVLGVSSINPFGTNELDIFEENMKQMTYADMQRMAIRVGLDPYHDLPKLKNMLIKQFKAINKNNQRNILPSSKQSIILDPNNPKHAETLKILGEF